MITKALYPWQRQAWQNWQRYLSQEKVPHAILLHGHRGCGIDDFALRACCSLLCSGDNIDKPCLECKTCRLFLSANHPDFLIIEAEREQIKIEQVRHAANFLQLNRHYLRYKVVLFKEVDNLNYAAANSLLKTLEEPPSEAIILMTCRQPSTLVPTIRSRCQRIYLREPLTASSEELSAAHNEESKIAIETIVWLADQMSISKEEAKKKLALANNSPLDALNEISDNEDKALFYSKLDQWVSRKMTIHEFVEDWHDKPAVEIQQWLLEYLQRRILKLAKEISKDQIDSATSKTELTNSLYCLYQQQIEHCRLARQNINPRLLLESSLLEWRKAYRNI